MGGGAEGRETLARRRSARSTAVPIVGAIAIWAVGWLALPGLDPAPRSDWWGRRRTVVTISADGGGLEAQRRGGGFERPWCPLCNLVEHHVTDNGWVNQTVGIGQLVGFAAITAAGLSLVDGAPAGRGGDLVIRHGVGLVPAPSYAPAAASGNADRSAGSPGRGRLGGV